MPQGSILGPVFFLFLIPVYFKRNNTREYKIDSKRDIEKVFISKRRNINRFSNISIAKHKNRRYNSPSVPNIQKDQKSKLPLPLNKTRVNIIRSHMKRINQLRIPKQNKRKK